MQFQSLPWFEVTVSFAVQSLQTWSLMCTVQLWILESLTECTLAAVQSIRERQRVARQGRTAGCALLGQTSASVSYWHILGYYPTSWISCHSSLRLHFNGYSAALRDQLSEGNGWLFLGLAALSQRIGFLWQRRNEFSPSPFPSAIKNPHLTFHQNVPPHHLALFTLRLISSSDRLHAKSAE